MSDHSSSKSLRSILRLVIISLLVFTTMVHSRATRSAGEHTTRQAPFSAFLPLVERDWYYRASGVLDPSFGGDGRLSIGFGLSIARGAAVAIQPDHRIVMAGYVWYDSEVDFALLRLNPDGSLDTSFGDGGRVVTDMGGSDYGTDVLLQPDGKIVVSGVVEDANGSDFALARYNPDGSLDGSFDGDGRVVTDFYGTDDHGYGIVLQADGKIVMVGYMGYVFALARYNPDGSLDPTFDEDGKVVTGFGADPARATAIALQPDGRIVAAGYSWNTAGDFALARYNSDGSLDTSFGVDGWVATDFNASDDYAYAVMIQPDGKIVCAGQTSLSENTDFALARYNPDGSLDTSFDGDGLVVTDFFGGTDEGNAVALQQGGEILVAGGTNYSDFALARYNPDGSLDLSFGVDGKVVTDFADSIDMAFAVLVQPDGRIVVAGMTMANGNNFGIARYR